jgi:hypothetical protein
LIHLWSKSTISNRLTDEDRGWDRKERQFHFCLFKLLLALPQWVVISLRNKSDSIKQLECPENYLKYPIGPKAVENRI